MLDSVLSWAVGGAAFGACFYTALLFRKPSVAADVPVTLLGMCVYAAIGALFGAIASLALITN